MGARATGAVLVAAVIVACDPVLVWQSRFVMTETLGAFLTAWALAALAQSGMARGRPRRRLPGTRRALPSQPAAGRVLIVLGSWLAGPVNRRRPAVPRAWRSPALSCRVLAPWALRNVLVLGEPVWTTTHGGYTLALANNEVYYRDVLDGPPGQVWTGDDQWHWWDSVNRATAGMTEPQADRYLRGTRRPARTRRAGDIPPGLRRPAGPVLERRPGLGRLSPARALGDRRSGPSRSGSPWSSVSCAAKLWSWPRVAAPLVDPGPDRRPRALLDRYPDARADRARRSPWWPPRLSSRSGSTGKRGGITTRRLARRACVSAEKAGGLSSMSRSGLLDEDDPPRHREADARGHDDADHRRGQLVSGEELKAHGQPEAERHADGDSQGIAQRVGEELAGDRAGS